MSSSDNTFINKNSIPMNNEIAFHSGNFKWNCQIGKTYSRDGVIHIFSCNIKFGKVIKILHKSILLDIFPDFDFGPDVWEKGKNDSL